MAYNVYKAEDIEHDFNFILHQFRFALMQNVLILKEPTSQPTVHLSVRGML